jgi:hypothetical protein
VFISRRQHAEGIFTRIWNMLNDFSSVFLMNTNLFKFVIISLSTLFMSPGLNHYTFTALMKGMYCSLLKEFPLWLMFPLACRSYQDRFCCGVFICNSLNQPGFSQTIYTTFCSMKGKSNIGVHNELACFVFGNWRFKISSQSFRKLLRYFRGFLQSLDECSCHNFD